MTAIAADVENSVLTPEISQAAKECVRYIVCREGSKIPIKRSDIIKNIASAADVPSNQINTVVTQANKLLKKVYGYRLLQVDSKGGVQFIVVLDKPCESVQSGAVDPKQHTMLIAALTHIHMSGGSVKEDDMWKFLETAGLLNENDHAGRKVLTQQFTKQLYLTYTKVGDADYSRFIFEWGQRATEELPKLYLMEKLGEAFNRSPDYWCEQYKAASNENLIDES